MTTTTSHVPVAGEAARAVRPTWAASGLVAGLAGIVSIVASSTTGAVYEEDIAGDAVAITDRLSEMVPQILVFHTATMLSALLLVVFAAGLQRQLVQRLGADSLLPGIGHRGLLLVAVARLHGVGPDHRVRLRGRRPRAARPGDRGASSATGSARSRGCGAVPG